MKSIESNLGQTLHVFSHCGVWEEKGASAWEGKERVVEYGEGLHLSEHITSSVLIGHARWLSGCRRKLPQLIA